jgi:hypothetical protein
VPRCPLLTQADIGDPNFAAALLVTADEVIE